jgi:hypothetical protein
MYYIDMDFYFVIFHSIYYIFRIYILHVEMKRLAILCVCVYIYIYSYLGIFFKYYIIQGWSCKKWLCQVNFI